MVMSFGGSAQAMNDSLKMNRRERKPIFKQEPFQEFGRDEALEFGECSEEDRQRLADQLARDIRIQRRKERMGLMVAIGTVAVLVALLLMLW